MEGSSSTTNTRGPLSVFTWPYLPGAQARAAACLSSVTRLWPSCERGCSGGRGVESASEQVKGRNGRILPHAFAVAGDPQLAGLGRLAREVEPDEHRAG